MRESILTAAHRVTYQQRHGPARTLRDMLAHELGRCIPGTSYRSRSSPEFVRRHAYHPAVPGGVAKV